MVVQSLPPIPADLAQQFDRLENVCVKAREVGRVHVALPDCDPDAGCSAHALKELVLPSADMTIFCGDGTNKAFKERAPHFLKNVSVLPITALGNLKAVDPKAPLLLLDAACIDQRNVGGPSTVLPDVVIDAHVGTNAKATQARVVSHEYVATGAILTDFIRERLFNNNPQA